MTQSLEPPKADRKWMDQERDVEPRDRDDLVANIMEIRGMSKPDAEDFVDEQGLEHCERLVQSRWE